MLCFQGMWSNNSCSFTYYSTFTSLTYPVSYPELPSGIEKRSLARHILINYHAHLPGTCFSRSSSQFNLSLFPLNNSSCLQVSFNPQDNTQLCVVGQGIFKLFRYSEGNLKQFAFQKLDPQNFLSHVWLSDEKIVAGTDTGRLLLFESGELRNEFHVNGGASPVGKWVDCQSIIWVKSV